MCGWSGGLIHAVRSASDTAVPARVEAWTDQHPAVVDRLRSTGHYHADGRRVPKSLRPALWWLRNEMRSRVPGATGRPPIWLTVVPMVTRVDVCDWSCARYGNLCSKLHITPGKDWLQLSVPANRTLVSDFDLWNRFVVQYRYVPENDDDADSWDRRVRRVLKVGRAEPTPMVSATSFSRRTADGDRRICTIFLKHVRQRGSPVVHDLFRFAMGGDRCAEERARRGDATPARHGRVDQPRCESLHPPVQRDVIDRDATFCEEFLQSQNDNPKR